MVSPKEELDEELKEEWEVGEKSSDSETAASTNSLARASAKTGALRTGSGTCCSALGRPLSAILAASWRAHLAANAPAARSASIALGLPRSRRIGVRERDDSRSIR